MNFFSFNAKDRAFASPLLPIFNLVPIERYVARSCDEDPARERMLFIYRSNSFGRWKNSRLLVTGEDTFVDVYLIISNEGDAATLARAETREAKKTLRPVITTACGAGHGVNVEHYTREKTLCRHVITVRKGYPSFRWASRAYQEYENIIYYHQHVPTQFRHLASSYTLFRKSKLGTIHIGICASV